MKLLIVTFVCLQVDSNVSVPKFCFPDADEFRPGSMATTRCVIYIFTSFVSSCSPILIQEPANFLVGVVEKGGEGGGFTLEKGWPAAMI